MKGMKTILFISIILFFNFSFSQEKVKGYVSLSQSSNLSFEFTETDLSLGVALPLKMGVISLFGSYQRGGNFGKSYYRSSVCHFYRKQRCE